MKIESRRSKGLAIALACALATSYVPSALAELPAELAAAREEFNRGLELEKDGKFEEALEKFEDVAKVKTSAQVLFHIGVCKEQLGQWGEAIETYEKAVQQATKDGNAAAVLSIAPERAAKLKEKRPKLTVEFANGQVPDSLAVDGRAINVLTAYPLDPGSHIVIAKKGTDTVRNEIKLGEGASMTLTLKFVPPKAAAYSDAAEHPTETHVIETPKSSGTARTAGFVVGGFGVLSLAAAGAFYAARSSALNELDGACDANLKCPTSAKGTNDRAKTYTMLSGISLGVGVAAVALGTVLIITGKQKEPEEARSARARFVPYAPNANLFGFGIEGAF